MKKLLIIAVVGCFALSLTSCKKSHTCTCTDSTGTKTTISLGKTSSKTAKDACAVYNVSGETCSVD